MWKPFFELGFIFALFPCTSSFAGILESWGSLKGVALVERYSECKIVLKVFQGAIILKPAIRPRVGRLQQKMSYELLLY